VACEACHGPGSLHVAWAKAYAEGGAYPPGTDASRMGLTNWLKPSDTGHWEMNPQTGIARRPLPTPGTPALAGSRPGAPLPGLDPGITGEGRVGVSTELETCAACHSRR
jgi:hypothetical protein